LQVRDKVMDGKSLAERLKSSLREEVLSLRRKGIVPTLAVILVGRDPSSIKYVESKKKDCSEIGIKSIDIRIPEGTPKREILERIKELNSEEKVHGILVQLPVPGVDEKDVIREISPDKDVDGLSPYNMGKLMIGDYSLRESLIPCTPKGVMILLKEYGVEIKGKHAVVINRSNLVGKPLQKLLLDEDATVTICHSKTVNIEEITRMGDIVVSAVGRRPKFHIGSEMLKDGVVAVDIGMSFLEGKLMGDFDFEEVLEKVSKITPMPGGVGPMTRYSLLENTVIATKINEGII